MAAEPTYSTIEEADECFLNESVLGTATSMALQIFANNLENVELAQYTASPWAFGDFSGNFGTRK